MLVASRIKCNYDANGNISNSIHGSPNADRSHGWELGVPVIDLNMEGIDFLTAHGPKPDDGDPTTENPPKGTLWCRKNSYAATFGGAGFVEIMCVVESNFTVIMWEKTMGTGTGGG